MKVKITYRVESDGKAIEKTAEFECDAVGDINQLVRVVSGALSEDSAKDK